MISISFGNNNGYSDYDDKKPGKVYRKVTSDSVIYYRYEPYPKGTSHYQYLMPIIERIIPRNSNRWDDNNENIYYIYRPIPPPPQPYYYYYPYPYYPPQPRSYYPRARSFATTGGCTPCKQGDIWCGALKWGCDVQNAIGSHYDQQQKILDQRNVEDAKKQGKPTPTPVSPGPPKIGVGASPKCNACNEGDIGCYIGKFSCEFTGATGDAFNSSVGALGQIWPMIAIGGGAIILILLLKR